jgi:hypothetical protein
MEHSSQNPIDKIRAGPLEIIFHGFARKEKLSHFLDEIDLKMQYNDIDWVSSQPTTISIRCKPNM